VTIFVNNSSTHHIDQADVRAVLPFHFPVPLAQRLKRLRGVAQLHEGQAFTFSGSLEGARREVVPVRLRIGNQFEQTIDVPVEGGYSTMLEMDLQ
jgi:hypothetical protein